MAKTLRVMNRAHTALVLTEPMPNPEKAGDAPPLRSVVLNSDGRPGTATSTELSGDDVEVFQAWKKSPAATAFLRDGLVEEGGEEDGETVYGHEAFLDKAEGSASTSKAKAGRVTAQELTPKGGGKPDDGPGEPRHATQPGEKEPKTGGV